MEQKSEQFLLEDDKALLPGAGISYYQFKKPDWKILKTFDLTHTIGDVPLITFETSELTALCPLTGFPDWYNLKIQYIPIKKCIESKSSKFYFGSYRDFGGFIETLADNILKDWVSACSPEWAQVDIIMNPRGGVAINAVKEYARKAHESK